MEQIYDLIIIGSGPAGLGAAIYAKRAELETLVIEKEMMSGGQVLTTYEVDNYAGLPGIGGFDLGMKFREHADKLGVEFAKDTVLKIEDADLADENEVLTTLVQGSVRFSAGNKSVILKPGEQAVLDKSGRVENRKVDTYLYTAWKDGVFAFKKQRLEEIMKVVARWYDVNVFWENASQKEVTFTGKMKRYDDFSKVVEILEMTGNTEFVVKENNIFIREK